MQNYTAVRRSGLDNHDFGVSTLRGLSLESPDIYIAVSDGKERFHSLLLAIHSPHLKDILTSVSDPSDAVIILTDSNMSEISTLVQVMSGIEDAGIFSGCFLDYLGMSEYKKFLVIEGPTPTDSVNVPFVISNDIVNDVITNVLSGDPADSTGNINYENENIVQNDPDEQTNNNSIVNIDGFLCLSCDKLVKSKKILQQHIKYQHATEDMVLQEKQRMAANKALSMRCTICDKKMNKRQLKQHFKSVHPEISLDVQCDLCDENFEHVSRLNRHKKNVHSSSQPDLKCNMCDFKTTMKFVLTNHLKIHGNTMHVCVSCDYITFRARYLKRHKCQQKLFSCDQCGDKSVSQDALRQHRKRKHS